MRKKEILNAIRSETDEFLETLGFSYHISKEEYVRHDKVNNLHQCISFLFFNNATVKHPMGKYLELYLWVYSHEISSIMYECSEIKEYVGRKFFFPILGNMLPDIVLNPDFDTYTFKSNHNYFKLTFESEEDLVTKPLAIVSLLRQYAVPFFAEYDTLPKIKTALDRHYETILPVHQIYLYRLKELIILFHLFKDPDLARKTDALEDYIIKVGDPKAIREVANLRQRLG
jgi:hypothetical protein